MLIFGNAKFKVYVYSDDHPPPHCHIRFSDGEDVSVDIPLIIPRYGMEISKNVEKAIVAHLEELCDAWEQLNKPRESKN